MTDKNPELEYHLEIVQQPVRARMCGHGDKDRRHISPPPFVKLNVIDSITRETVDVDSIDINFSVLIVELWSSDEKEDLTLDQNFSTDIPPKIEDRQSSIETSPRLASTSAGASTSLVTKTHNSSPSLSDSDESVDEIPTRNIIGNLVLNPFKLFDENNEKGIWFIMHGLSIRIEGEFKLRLLFTDLSSNKSSSIFTQPFRVYSAKKFPGVVESSPLGKVFASQGVKIPIRRDSRNDGK